LGDQSRAHAVVGKAGLAIILVEIGNGPVQPVPAVLAGSIRASTAPTYNRSYG
jgi:hypothetical protein